MMKKITLFILLITTIQWTVNAQSSESTSNTDSVYLKDGKIITGKVVGPYGKKNHSFVIRQEGKNPKFTVENTKRVVANNGRVYVPMPLKPEKNNDKKTLLELVNAYGDYKVYMRKEMTSNANLIYYVYIYKNDRFVEYMRRKNTAKYIPLCFGNCEQLVELAKRDKLYEEEACSKYYEYCRKIK